MKIVNSGNLFDIFDDSIQTFDKLPAQSYVVRFQDLKGFSLEKYVDIETGEDKIYGVHNEKAEKALDSFDVFDRSLGVILSGDKGIGKSLFAKILAKNAIKKGIPVVVVDRYVPGIASYLERIEQEVLVLFDEFDKTFGLKQKEDTIDPQAEMLGLFDGISSGKKLFVITCNDLNRLNEYLTNRPGRFHYHFRFEYPNDVEIKEYLTDKLEEKYYGEIKAVVSFSHRVDLNYDCLRAIAFELNLGISFKDAIRDLNIINFDEYTRYNITLHYANGLTANYYGWKLDLSDANDVSMWLTDKNGDGWVRVTFPPSSAVFDASKMCYVVMPENIRGVRYDDSCGYDEDEKELQELVKCAKSSSIDCLTLRRQARKDFHYVV